MTGDSLLFLFDGHPEYAEYFGQKRRMILLETLVNVHEIVGSEFLETDQFCFGHFLQHESIVCSKPKIEK